MELCVGPRVSVKVLDLIENADDRLWLISPYFQPWGRLEQTIQNAVDVRDVDTLFLLRGGRDREEQETNVKPFQKAGANVVFLKRLHAKVYLNEQEAIITSMNLLESSALDSWEIAVRIPRRTETKIYSEVVEKCETMLHQAGQEAARQPDTSKKLLDTISELARTGTSRSGSRKSIRGASRSSRSGTSSSSKQGTCIRCSTAIKLDIDRPLCRPCWDVWKKYENEDYEEKYCLRCGKEHESTFAKPMCYDCYKEHV